MQQGNPKLLVLGYDPGGRHSADHERGTGAAIIRVDTDNRKSAIVAPPDKYGVDAIFAWFVEKTRAEAPVKAAGIDTLLSWSSCASGLRPMDCCLKLIYREAQKSVQASNSLSGAMAVQGMAMAIRLRREWPGIILNETHPKVQYYAERKQLYNYKNKDGIEMNDWLRREMGCHPFPPLSTPHQWDALYSAWVTLQAVRQECAPDLLELAGSRDTLLFPAGPVHYYWLWPFDA